MQSNILPMFPGEHHFTSRKTPANLSTGPEFVPEAQMWLDAKQSDFGPHVNSCFDTTDDDAKAIVKIVVVMWAVFLAVGVVLVMIYVPAWEAGK